MKLIDAKIGDEVLGFYSLTRCELVPFDGGVRLDLEFGDASGKMNGVMWNADAETAYPGIKDAGVVKIRGLVSSYRGEPQLAVDKIRMAKPEEYDLSELLPTSVHSLEELEKGIGGIIELINDAELNKLVSDILNDPAIRQHYFEAPAGKQWHHPYLRGLAEHSLSMAQAAAKLCEHYTHLDRSLLLAGTLLHDIGKIIELEITSSLDYSVEGRLFGHMVIGYQLVRNHAVKLELQDDVNVRKLLHMILSHQGKKENSSPVLPAFEEAYVLYFIDEIDSKLNSIGLIRSKPENEGAEFTKFVKLLDTMLFLRKKGE